MTASSSTKDIRMIALRALEELSVELEVDPEMIESLSPRELRARMMEMGLDPDRSIPHLPARSSDTEVDQRLRRGSDNVVFDTERHPESNDVEHSSGIRLLVDRDANGTCAYVTIDALLDHPQVVRRLKGMCSRFDFRPFCGAYDAEDLYQDALMKVWKRREKLGAPGNILGDKEFEGWLYVVVRNHYLTKIRNLKGSSRSLVPIEEINLATAGNRYDKSLLRHFLEFMKGYPESTRRTIRLWLEGYSYREIEKMLKSRGVQCSHVTVGDWIAKVILAFRQTVKGVDTEAARSRAVAMSLLQRRLNEQ